MKWCKDFITYKSILLEKWRWAPKQMRKLLIWWEMEVLGKSDQEKGPHALPDHDIVDLIKQVKDWQVESNSDSDDDHPSIWTLYFICSPANFFSSTNTITRHYSYSIPCQCHTRLRDSKHFYISSHWCSTISFLYPTIPQRWPTYQKDDLKVVYICMVLVLVIGTNKSKVGVDGELVMWWSTPSFYHLA